MARFTRAADVTELVREPRAIVERTLAGEARRELHDERAALIAYYLRILDLLTAGWRRVTPFVDDLVIAPEPTELIAAVDAGDPGALAVYTDWLIEHGDARGELATLRGGHIADERTIKSLEKTRGLELFGPLAFVPAAWRAQFAYVWRYGWIHEVIVRVVPTELVVPPDTEILQHALHAPMARFAGWLDVDRVFAIVIYQRLAGCSCLQRIRGLRVGATHRFPELLDEILGVLPALEELELLDGAMRRGHPRVRRIRISIDDVVPAIGGPWPALERLEIVATERGVMQNWARLYAALPSVRHLVIDAPFLPEHAADAIAKSVLQLETLEIRAPMSERAKSMLPRVRVE